MPPSPRSLMVSYLPRNVLPAIMEIRRASADGDSLTNVGHKLGRCAGKLSEAGQGCNRPGDAGHVVAVLSRASRKGAEAQRNTGQELRRLVVTPFVRCLRQALRREAKCSII